MRKIVNEHEAINRLRDAGYHVEHEPVHGIIYARKMAANGHGTGLPSRLYKTRGGFSELALIRLEKKAAVRG